MGLQFPSCTTFELIEVFIPDQLHQELTAKEIMGLKMAVQQRHQQGNWGGGNIITRVDEIWISQNNNQTLALTHRGEQGVRLSVANCRCEKNYHQRWGWFADFVKRLLLYNDNKFEATITCSPLISEEMKATGTSGETSSVHPHLSAYPVHIVLVQLYDIIMFAPNVCYEHK